MKAVVEIPCGSEFKYEIDKQTGRLVLDRVLNQPVPANYGYLEGTLADDGDPLDVFVQTHSPLIAGSVCKIYVLGMFICRDNGVQDNKILAHLEDWAYSKPLYDIEQYLRTYKDLFEYHSFVGYTEAIAEIEKCRNRVTHEIF